MYRKIVLLLFFNFQSLNINLKLSVILLIMFIMLLLITHCRPFIYQNHNNLEFYSSFSAFFLIFVAYLYLTEVSLVIKAICFIMINLTNILFFIPWVFEVIRVIIFRYHSFFVSFLPKTTTIILVIERTLNFMLDENCFNPFKLMKIAKLNYKQIFKLRKQAQKTKIGFKKELDSLFMGNSQLRPEK